MKQTEYKCESMIEYLSRIGCLDKKIPDVSIPDVRIAVKWNEIVNEISRTKIESHFMIPTT